MKKLSFLFFANFLMPWHFARSTTRRTVDKYFRIGFEENFFLQQSSNVYPSVEISFIFFGHTKERESSSYFLSRSFFSVAFLCFFSSRKIFFGWREIKIKNIWHTLQNVWLFFSKLFRKICWLESNLNQVVTEFFRNWSGLLRNDRVLVNANDISLCRLDGMYSAGAFFGSYHFIVRGEVHVFCAANHYAAHG